MTLVPGTRLGQYEIVSAIGAGGMGEVYRARDTKLNRDVAIKVLPPAFAQDRDRLARFEREAQSLAALNHPHIAQIYGVLDSALVMEFADGEDLAARLRRGAIPLNEALPLAIQIAGALEAAHERGIIHRDLKPANIKVTESGAVKVLDFGLAKAMAADASGVGQGFSPASPNESPTFTSPAMTQLGVILGTAAYMSPEQAKGKAVDRRADVWAFGGVLFEMLTGKRAFEGEDVTDVIASIMRAEPDWNALPAATPPAVRKLLRRCLEKDRGKRLDSMAVARYEIEEALAAPIAAAATAAEEARRRRVPWLPWAIAALMTVAAIAFGVRAMRPPAAPPAAALRASLPPPPGTMFTGALALSPDGTRLVFSAVADGSALPMLWVQDLATGVTSPIRQTEGAAAPFWSPDGREIGFFAAEKLKRVPVGGGPAQVVAPAANQRGGTWTPDGRIIFAPDFRSGLMSVDARGGSPTPITTVTGRETSHRWPQVLPDGRHLIFLAQTSEGGTEDDASTIDIVDANGQGRRTLVRENSSPLYAAPGYLLFWRAGALHAQLLDPRTWTAGDNAAVVAEDVEYDQNERVLATAAAGRLVFAPGGGAGGAGLITPSWVDRFGKVTGQVLPPNHHYGCGLALSPTANLLAFGRTAPGGNGCDLWVRDLDRAVDAPLTIGGRNEYGPIFAPGGTKLIYGTDTGADGILRVDVRGGTPETLFQKADGYSALDAGAVTRDGRMLIASAARVGTREDIIRYDIVEKKLYPIVTNPSSDVTPVLSPDEKWIAYASNRTGRMEIYVEPVTGGPAWAVSSTGGFFPQWRSDGKELFYLSAAVADTMLSGFTAAAADRLMSVQVLPGTEFRTSAPKELFKLSFSVDAGYAVAPGGQRFIFGLVERGAPRPLQILTGWTPAR